MSDLIAFLTARIDEDEATALVCLDINERVKIRRGLTPPRWLTSPDSSNITDEAGILRVRHTWTREAAHIIRHDPARVLREIEAKRALIAFALKNAANIDGEWGDGHNAEEIAAGQCEDHGAEAAGEILIPLAAIHSDHPDHRDDWKP